MRYCSKNRKLVVKMTDLHKEYNPKVFNLYWKFAAERQRIFFRKNEIHNRKLIPILTDDPILSSRKFTNAYRASDRVSQYLIRNVIYDSNDYSTEDMFFRIMLFKTFNRIDTWKQLKSIIGPIELKNYSFKKYNDFLTYYQTRSPIFSNAYMMPSPEKFFREKGYDYNAKHSNHLLLIEWMMEQKYPERIANASSMKEVYDIFLSTPSIGSFLAYQYAIDINYSEMTDFSESDFTVAGPGAIDGISKCFPSYKNLDTTDIIKFAGDNQDYFFNKLNIEFPDLWGRKLQYIDCQNLFCEISKYTREALPDVVGASGRLHIKQRYTPSHMIDVPFYPPKWNINSKIQYDNSREMVLDENSNALF